MGRRECGDARPRSLFRQALARCGTASLQLRVNGRIVAEYGSTALYILCTRDVACRVLLDIFGSSNTKVTYCGNSLYVTHTASLRGRAPMA